ncbi:hypothetical protein LCGC14_0586860 [marine sediment metagenome]|uniref:Uncharacterized protein n=1 Tax=marine sediment metagenome TaxID=412755 RepID=A0A0F9RJN6_9ZZZZ
MSGKDKFNDGPIAWHWTETEVSIDLILRKSAAVRRIRNKLKENKRINFPIFLIII